jgi:hypothetical protein
MAVVAPTAVTWGSACDDWGECFEAVVDSCDASGSSWAIVEISQSGGCSGECTNGQLVEVVCNPPS